MELFELMMVKYCCTAMHNKNLSLNRLITQINLAQRLQSHTTRCCWVDMTQNITCGARYFSCD